MPREIRKVAVLGAGVMGAGIAAHLANAGVESLLYDIVPKEGERNALARKGCIAMEEHRQDGQESVDTRKNENPQAS